MHMILYWGTRVTILFDSWRTDSYLSYALSLLVCFLVSFLYQYLEDTRLRLIKRCKTPSSAVHGSTNTNTTSLFVPSKLGLRDGSNWGPSRFAGAAMFGVAIFGVNAAIGYMLMLAVMSFNAGVFVAVMVGLVVGYLVFRGDDDGDAVVQLQPVDNPCTCG